MPVPNLMRHYCSTLNEIFPLCRLDSPSSIQLCLPPQPEQIFHQLSQVYPALTAAAVESEYLTLIEPVTPKIGLYQFAYQAYTEAVKASKNKYYAKGNDLLTKALIEYLNSYGYEQAELAEQAHWQLSIHYHNGDDFTVDYHNKSTPAASLNSETV